MAHEQKCGLATVTRQQTSVYFYTTIYNYQTPYHHYHCPPNQQSLTRASQVRYRSNKDYKERKHKKTFQNAARRRPSSGTSLTTITTTPIFPPFYVSKTNRDKTPQLTQGKSPLTQLIQECIDNFSISSDRAALHRISTSLTTLTTHRTQLLQTRSAALKRAQRHLHTLDQQHSLSVTQHDPADHAARILGLDKEKFRVAKEASDAEIEGERLEGELGGLERAVGALGGERARAGPGEIGDGVGGQWDVQREGEEGLQDVLRLKLYRSLGVDLERDEETGVARRAVVRNMVRGDARVIEFDGRETGAAQRVWDAL